MNRMQTKLLFLILLVSISFNSVFAQGNIDYREAQCCANGCSFKSFLSKTIKYPVSAQEKNLQGQVIIDFVVDKDGCLKDFIPVKQFDKECTSYAIKTLKSSPEWLPKIEKGRPIESKQSVVIYFKLIGADTEMDIEPRDNDIIVWGYGSTREKTLN